MLSFEMTEQSEYAPEDTELNIRVTDILVTMHPRHDAPRPARRGRICAHSNGPTEARAG